MHSWTSVGSHPDQGDDIQRSLSPPMIQARRYADTGKVCIGPVGTPVSGRDRQMLQVIQEVDPDVMNNWFEDSYGARFYTSKFQMGDDPSKPMGTCYALYRSLVGPAILSDWTEVAPAVIGVPGSLFQKCPSFLDASLRMAQAWMIGGIVYTIPRSVVGATSTDLWLEAFACSSLPALRIPMEAVPQLDAVPPCSLSGAPDEVLDAEVLGEWWQTFLPGRKPTKDYTPTVQYPQGVIVTPLVAGRSIGGHRDAPPSRASASSSDAEAQRPSRYRADTRSVPVPPSPSTSACGDPEEVALPICIGAFAGGYSGASRRGNDGGYVAVLCGETPWLFPNGGDIVNWLPQSGSGHVAYYATFREALEGFRDALKVGRIRAS